MFHFHPLTNIHLVHRDFYHLFLIVIDFDISKLHCEDLGSYQTITFLLQSERLNKLTFTSLPTTAYLSHLPSPNPSHNLSPNRFSKCMKNKRCFSFLQEIGRRITKTNFGVLKSYTKHNLSVKNSSRQWCLLGLGLVKIWLFRIKEMIFL